MTTQKKLSNFALAVGLACAAAGAQANQIVQTLGFHLSNACATCTTVPSTLAANQTGAVVNNGEDEIFQTLTFQKFNTNLGTLTSLTWDVITTNTAPFSQFSGSTTATATAVSGNAAMDIAGYDITAETSGLKGTTGNAVSFTQNAAPLSLTPPSGTNTAPGTASVMPAHA